MTTAKSVMLHFQGYFEKTIEYLENVFLTQDENKSLKDLAVADIFFDWKTYDENKLLHENLINELNRRLQICVDRYKSFGRESSFYYYTDLVERDHILFTLWFINRYVIPKILINDGEMEPDKPIGSLLFKWQDNNVTAPMIVGVASCLEKLNDLLLFYGHSKERPFHRVWMETVVVLFNLFYKEYHFIKQRRDINFALKWPIHANEPDDYFIHYTSTIDLPDLYLKFISRIKSALESSDTLRTAYIEQRDPDYYGVQVDPLCVDFHKIVNMLFRDKVCPNDSDVFFYSMYLSPYTLDYKRKYEEAKGYIEETQRAFQNFINIISPPLSVDAQLHMNVRVQNLENALRNVGQQLNY